MTTAIPAAYQARVSQGSPQELKQGSARLWLTAPRGSSDTILDMLPKVDFADVSSCLYICLSFPGRHRDIAWKSVLVHYR